MLIPATSSEAIGCALLTLVWGLWPWARNRCGAPMPVFSLVYTTSQLIIALFFLLTLGSLPFGDTTITASYAWDHAHELWSLRVLAIFAGGYCVGHADNIGSYVMELIPPGIAMQLTGGGNVIGGSVLDYFVSGSSHPYNLFGGVALILCACICLSNTLPDAKDQPPNAAMGTETDKNDESFGCSDATPDSSNLEEALIQSGAAGAKEAHGSSSQGSQQPQNVGSAVSRSRTNHIRRAVLLCLLSSACGACWSPLVSYGYKKGHIVGNPYVAYSVYALGAVCAWPSVAAIGTWLGEDAQFKVSHRGRSSSFRRHGRRLVRMLSTSSRPSWMWGAITGAIVAIGYIGYFLASSKVSSTVAFPISQCAPLIALFVEISTGEFRGSSRRRLGFLSASIFFYVSAVVVITLGEA